MITRCIHEELKKLPHAEALGAGIFSKRIRRIPCHHTRIVDFDQSTCSKKTFSDREKEPEEKAGVKEETKKAKHHERPRSDLTTNQEGGEGIEDQTLAVETTVSADRCIREVLKSMYTSLLLLLFKPYRSRGLSRKGIKPHQ